MPLAHRRTFSYAPDVTINYRVYGRGPTPIVFIHGFAAALTTWLDIAPLFPEERFTLYLADLKGFGFSSKPSTGSYSVEEQAAIVTAFVRQLGLQQTVLVGHSLGGGIALMAQLNAEESGKGLASRLVLIDCAAYFQRLPRFMRYLRIPLLGRLFMGIIPVRRLVGLTLDKVFHDKSAITPERIERYEKCFARSGMARVLVQSVQELRPERYGDIAGRYGELKVPTLIIWGREDRIVRLEQGERLHGAIGGSTLAVIGSCGHNPHEERPQETFDAIMEFLEKSER